MFGGIFQLHKVGIADGGAAVKHQHDAHHLLLGEGGLGVLHLAVHLPAATIVLPAVEFQAAVKSLGVGGGGVPWLRMLYSFHGCPVLVGVAS